MSDTPISKAFQRLLQPMAIGLAKRALPLRIRGIPRLMFKTAPYIFGHGIELRPTVAGFRLCADTRQYSDVMMLYGRYSPEFIRLFQILLRPGDRVIDIGAQLGYISAHIASLVGPAGAVYSLEPDPAILPRLRQTMEQNRFHWVHILPYAASDHRGTISFFISPTPGWSTAVPGSHRTELIHTEVECMTIDELAAGGSIQGPVRLIKIDVEGHECSVLDGMGELLDRDRPLVLMEVNPDMMAPLRLGTFDQLERIYNHRYRFYTVHEQTGLLKGGTPILKALPGPRAIGFCDVLCVPAEAPLPQGLCLSGND